MKILLYLFLFLFLVNSCFAQQTLLIKNDYTYELFGPLDEIPQELLEEGLSMYINAYSSPNLHEGISLEQLQIDKSQFCSYDEYIAEMFCSDFKSYRLPGGPRQYYLQTRRIQDRQVVGICAVLKQTDSFYIDHLGVHKDFRRQKIGYNLISELLKIIGPIKISLDTRVFNKPAQFFYEKLGFKKLENHPNHNKQLIYYHYIFEEK